ncbi:hypothetical protein [Nonomuraea recticatena]|uniref:hypothetical protein n=1 Tax=Nonomuraea recticatena TaxID=46178 RepID=UPI00361941F5
MAAYEKLQQVLDWAVAEAGVPGIVADVRDGDRTWFGTAGVADIETGVRRQPGSTCTPAAAARPSPPPLSWPWRPRAC